jgi:flagellar basal-body rod protein FlgB
MLARKLQSVRQARGDLPVRGEMDMTASQRRNQQTYFNRNKRFNVRQALSLSAAAVESQPGTNGEKSMSRLDDALSFHQTALDLRSQRQAVIASNIANADTPNYKARDMNFGAALRGAMQGRAGQPLALTTTASRHIAMTGMATTATLQYRPESQSSVDGNTVDMDVERSAMADNSVQYEASLSFINALLKNMQAAVSSQNG